MAAKLEIRDLTKEFEGVRAVRDLNISLHAGEFLSLLGPSGCGKSTTLAMIAGFHEPTSGEIVVDGQVINGVAPQHRRIGLVFQDYAVFTRLKVRENLSFGLEVRKVPRAERRRLVADMAEKLDLSHALERRGARLNMSEMQRVALGRVLIVRPQLLLLDEPMSNLDASIRAALRTELKQIQQELEQSVLYVTHDQVEAMSMSDRIAVMHEGRLLQVGSPHDVYNHPVNRFVAEFIGDPPINIIPCQVERSGDGLVGRTAAHSGLSLGRAGLEPGDHLLAVRPHDLAVADTPGPETAESVVRIIENFGSEHVAHLEYGDQLVRVVGRPGFVEPDQRVHLSLPAERAHLIEARSERVVERRSYGAAA